MSVPSPGLRPPGGRRPGCPLAGATPWLPLGRGGHGPTPPQPKQATVFTTSHAHIIASISSAAKA
eukprot:2620539-Prymnesium_polylepis.1